MARFNRKHIFFAAAAIGAASLVITVLERPKQGLSSHIESGPVVMTSHPASSRELASEGFEREKLCTDIYETVCHLRGVTRDPTGSVRSDVEGELQVLRTYEEIGRVHPQWDSEQVDEELAQQIYTPRRRAKLESAYHWVLTTIREFLKQQPDQVLNRTERKRLLQLLSAVKFELPPPARIYADEPELLTKNDVFYERLQDGTTRLRIGGAYLLTARSWFNMVFTMAHELAHAIDPCETRSSGLAIPAYDRLSACFIRDGLVATGKNRMECGHNDQLSETFADWVAAHVASEALAHFGTEFHGSQLLGAITNSVRDLCEQEDDPDQLDVSLHPPARLRINRIFGQNPKLRAVLGCEESTRTPAQAPQPAPPAKDYCDFNATFSEPKILPRSPQR